MDKLYAVFCLQDGKYVLATSSLFRNQYAADYYAGGCAPDRKAVVWFIGDKMQQVAELLDRSYSARGVPT